MYSIVTTYRNESVDGVPKGVLISALQKEVRRCRADEVLKILVALDHFPEDSQAGKRVRTNMVNRLLVMLPEDVGPSATNVITEVVGLWQQWLEVRADPIRSRPLLGKMGWLVATAPKTRMISDLKAIHQLPPRSNKEEKSATSSVLDYVGWRQPSFDEWSPEPFEQAIGRPVLTMSIFLSLRSYLVHWTIASGWELLLARSGVPAAALALRQVWKKMIHKERPIYFYAALLVIIHGDHVVAAPPFDEQKYLDMYSTKQPYVPPDYVYDVHTKRRGASTLDFAITGAKVCNEATKFLNKSARVVYVLSKAANSGYPLVANVAPPVWPKDFVAAAKMAGVPELKDNIPNPTELDKLPRGQVRCGASKPSVLIGSQFIYKGPYPMGSSKLIAAVVRSKWISIIESDLGVEPTIEPWVGWFRLGSNGIILVQKNVGDMSQAATEQRTTKLETNVTVLKRNSYVLQGSRIDDKLSSAAKGRILQHHYVRALLGAGDSGPHNTLVVKGSHRVVGIDYEETVAKREHGSAANWREFLFRRVSKAQYDIYGTKELRRITVFDFWQRHPFATMGRLQEAGCDTRYILWRAAQFMMAMDEALEMA